MKKLLLVLSVLAMTAPVFAARTDDFDKGLQKSADKAARAAVNSNMEVSFTVTNVFDNYDIVDDNSFVSIAYQVPSFDEKGYDKAERILVAEREYGNGTLYVDSEGKDKDGNYHEIILPMQSVKKGCAMFPIDENWLIGSRECVGTQETQHFSYDLISGEYPVVERRVEGKLYFNNDKDISAPAKGHIFYAYKDAKGYTHTPNVVLVYIGDTPAKELMAKKANANVLFFSGNIFSLFEDGTVANKGFKLRKSRFVSDFVKNTSLKMGSYNGGKFELKGQSGHGGDALFYQDQDGVQYLVGFNAGTIEQTTSGLHYMFADYEGMESKNFFDLHKADYEFVKKTIQAKDSAAWKRIEKNLQLL